MRKFCSRYPVQLISNLYFSVIKIEHELWKLNEIVIKKKISINTKFKRIEARVKTYLLVVAIAFNNTS